MYFGLSDKQLTLVEHYAGLLSQIESEDKVAGSSLGGIRADIARLVTPEIAGGDGHGLLEFAVVAEQIGKAGAAVPLIGCLAAILTFREGSPALAKQWLPRFFSAAARCAVGFDGGVGHAQQTSLKYEPDRVSGTLATVIDAPEASHLLLFGSDGIPRLIGIGDRVAVTIQPSIDPARPVARIDLDAATFVRLAEIANASSLTVDALRIALAAETLGAATALLERSVAYAKERKQFGREIGSYQGVKFTCAEMVTMLEPCRALVWQAAYAFDNDTDLVHEFACHTKAHVCDVAREVARMSVELHGAYGFSESSGLHGWFKRIALNRQLLGSPEYCREAAGTL